MRLLGNGKLAVHIGSLALAMAAIGSPVVAQVETSSSTSSSKTNDITYTAVLRDESQPPQDQNPQNPNAPNQPAPQQPEPARKPKYEFYLGPDIGVFMPTSSKTRDRFGSDWLSYGVGISSISTPHSNGRFSADIQILSQQNGDDSLFFGLIGVEYRQALIPGQGHKAAKPQPGQPQPEPPHNRDYIPYFGFSADEVIGDLVAVEDNVHSGVRTGVAGSAFLGIEYRNKAYIQFRYLQTSELKSFDLSGFSLTVGYRFKIVGY